MTFVTTESILMKGGLDLASTPGEIDPGRLIACKNYEPTARGYMRCDGVERLDGHPKPSDATYYVLNFTNGSANLTSGQTVTGATSAATGVLVADAVVSSGSFGGGNAAGYLVLTTSTAANFVGSENLQVGGITKCVSSGTPVSRGASSDALDATYYQAAVTYARSIIAAPAGAGPQLGTWILNGVKYCFRNNVGNTAAVMWKSTAAGWVQVSLGFSLNFTLATSGYTPVEGDTITGATSGATGVLQRICITSGVGTWGTGATGYFIIASQTGTFQLAEQLNVGAHANICTTSTIAVAQTLGASGKFDFHTENFFGNSGAKRMYGCNGQGRGFEFDGTVFVSIQTGMTTDKPQKVSAYKKQLFFSFANGSLQNGGPGTPYTWSVVLGAAEIGSGDDIMGISKNYLDGLMVYGRNRIQLLSGNTVADFVFTDVTQDSGAIEWTDQQLVVPIHLDNLGLRNLTATPSYGNFDMGSLSLNVRKVFDAKLAAGVTINCTVVMKRKSQYRVFFSDGDVLIFYFGKQNDGGVSQMTPAGIPVATGVPQVGLLTLPMIANTACSITDSSATDGTETTLIGCTDGMVYEMDKGTSFDGAAVEAFMRLAFYDGRTSQRPGSPTTRKAWKRALVNIDAAPTANIYVSAEFGFGDPDGISQAETLFAVSGGGGYWNSAFWNQFYWTSSYAGTAVAPVEGVAPTVSLAIYSNTIWDLPHTVQSVIYNYAPRGPQR